MLIVTVLNTQPENAADLILMVAFGIVTSASAVQPENALVPILTTLAGNVTVASVVQPSNALSPITVTPLLKLISVSAVQPENALVSKNIQIGDSDALFNVKKYPTETVTTIVWQCGTTLLCVVTTDTSEVAIQFAQSIKVLR